METKIYVYLSHSVSKDLEERLSTKLKAKFGNYPIEFFEDKSLILGLLVKFKDDEFYFNLEHEVEHILQSLVF